MRATAPSILPFLIGKLRDFLGLNANLHHDIMDQGGLAFTVSQLLLSIAFIMVLLPMNGFRGGMEHAPPILGGRALRSVEFSMTSIAFMGDIKQILLQCPLTG
ncbi:hypothetical protein ElyMa_005258200 [Elysia marginata]|uniref:Uncharacterized protein n=1 Tax=Elysia marginata TaxID=1093978 RepID=A0AAV4K2B4_9GAST|nr:hypothetical protein ElyMa_005258200 [Elysia marginata]